MPKRSSDQVVQSDKSPLQVGIKTVNVTIYNFRQAIVRFLNDSFFSDLYLHCRQMKICFTLTKTIKTAKKMEIHPTVKEVNILG